MRAITIRHPWAHLVAASIKRVENRSWPTAHRGPLAIHAAKLADRLDAGTLAELELRGIAIPPADTLAYGAIIGIVNVVDCVAFEDLPPALADDPFASGPFCWILADARILTPIPCRGQLGLWEAPATMATA